MKKRVLAVLMSVCLLVTSVFSLGILVSAESGYVLTELDYMINGTKMVNSYRELISHGVVWDTPVDLKALGHGEKKLGLQMDFYVSGGDLDMVRKASGQIELTSSGGGDREEIYWNTSDINWKEGEWVRQVFPLASAHTTGGTLNPEALNYMRVYFVGLEEKFVSEQITLKIGNVRIVDMDQPAPSLEEDP
ncbi:MAG: hypothetical protein J6R77_07445, partial [Clostridia bacterium]|nr:hypothetical protein [Clostridia bacterium]